MERAPGGNPPGRAPEPTLTRAAAIALVLAGLLFATGVFHPDVFDSGFANAVRSTPQWALLHWGWLLAMVLSLVGFAGVGLAQEARLGVVGMIGLLMLVPGLVLAASAMWFEATAMPVLAAHDPELLDLDGPLLSAASVRASAGGAGLWLLGLVLFGVATMRAGVMPRGAAATLAVGALCLAAFQGVFVPVLGVLAVLVFAAGHVWLGWALWSVRRGEAAHPGPATA